jgi:hypothetical protein
MEKKPGRARIELGKEQKNYSLINNTDVYYNKLKTAYQDLSNDMISEYTLFSFVTLCAATLEYSLNYVLAEFCFTNYPLNRFNIHFAVMERMNFKSKLMLVPFICSNNSFMIKNSDSSFHSLTRLIKVRNDLMYAMDTPEAFDSLQIIKSDNGEIGINLEKKPTMIEQLTKEECLEFADALLKYKSLVLDHCSEATFEVNDLLARNIHSRFKSQSKRDKPPKEGQKPL